MGRGIAVQSDDQRLAPLCLQRLPEEGFRRRDIIASPRPEINGPAFLVQTPQILMLVSSTRQE
jgi:hypothetical protein